MGETFGELLKSALLKIHPDEQMEIEGFMLAVTEKEPERMAEEIPEPYFSLLHDIFVAAHTTTVFEESTKAVMAVLHKFEEVHGKVTDSGKDRIMGMAEHVYRTFQPLDRLIVERGLRRKGQLSDTGIPIVDSQDYDEEKHGLAQSTYTIVPGLGKIKVSNQN